jgi:hypothetical protein
MTLMYDAIVTGGGEVGMSTAYHVIGGDAKTGLNDRADRSRATDAGAEILSAQTNGTHRTADVSAFDITRFATDATAAQSPAISA